MVKLDLGNLEQVVNQAIGGGIHTQTFAAVSALIEKELQQAVSTDRAKLQELQERLQSAKSTIPATLCLLFYSDKDEDWARRLRLFFSVLERQGVLRIWSQSDILPGADRDKTIQQMLGQADVILLLLSPDFLADEWPRWETPILLQGAKRGSRIIPVLLRPVPVLPKGLHNRQLLPRDGRPVRSSSDPDVALAGLTDEVRKVVETLRTMPLTLAHEEVDVKGRSATGAAAELPKITRIFRSDGIPDLNFVEPEQLSRLRIELDTPGRCLIVEGPSKVGKSTAVKHVLREQGCMTKNGKPRVGRLVELDGKEAKDPQRRDAFLKRLTKELDALLRVTQPRHLVIDDFHYVDSAEVRYQIASCSKALADQHDPKGKITLIGINPLGRSLTDALPDLSGRYRLVQMDQQPDAKIIELIVRGEAAANVRFVLRDEFVAESNGSFFIAQLLCQEAATRSGITVAQSERRDISISPAQVIDAMKVELRARYHDALRNLAAHDVKAPPRGAGLALLWLLSKVPDGHISLIEARQRFPSIADAIDWLASSNLQTVFNEHVELKSLLYYNKAAGMLSLEDPQLKFYLRKLNWAELADASGHKGIRWHLVDGPIFPSRKSQDGPQHTAILPSSEVVSPVGRQRYVLHLSDLHFVTSTEDQATRLYAPLSQDLREQGVERLDAVVLSGDIGTFSVPEEYAAARQFVFMLMDGFALEASQVVIVPGNHDLNWDLSQDAYTPHRRSRYRGPLVDGKFIDKGEFVEVREEETYRQRFRHFAAFYKEVRGEDYPWDPAAQATLQDLPDKGLLFLGLNSAYQIDHHFTARAGINPEAMAQAVLALDRHHGERLRIAVWHHPLTSPDPERIGDAGFLQSLAVARFRLGLHGHIHRSDNQLYRYDMHQSGRQIDLIAAGTFGAPARQWSPGYPLQYNLLKIDAARIAVETRCRDNPTGAWRPDARWQQGPGKDPLPRYLLAK